MVEGDGRHGAARKSGSKKGAKVGAGGHSRRRLEGKGPAPGVKDHIYHPVHRRKVQRKTHENRETTVARTRARGFIKIAPGCEFIAGRNLVAKAVRASVPVGRVFIPGNVKDDRVEEVIHQAARLGTPMFEVVRRNPDIATGRTVHQGVAIEAQDYEYVQVNDLTVGFLQQLSTPSPAVLDRTTDPYDLGVVPCLADILGVDGVIIPERRSTGVNTTAWKMSMGAAARVPVAKTTNFVRALGGYERAGFFVVRSDGDGGTELRDLPLAISPLIIVTGAEGAGLSRLVRETYDQIVLIPIFLAVKFLDAAVATGIVLCKVVSLQAEE